MRHRFSLGWAGASLLSVWLLAGAILVFSYVALGDAPGASAAEEGTFAVNPGDEAVTPPEGEAAAPKSQSQLAWMFQALGLFYTITFLGISFTFVALLVMNILAIRRENVVPMALIDGFEEHLNEKRYQEAYEMAKNDESFLGQVLSAGLAKLSGGYEQAVQAMEEVGSEENMKLEHRLSYIALIGSIAPMVGLLGTVDGMIASFSVIANSPTAPKPSELAAGIATALFTTLVGLWIAIPAVTAYNLIKCRLARLMLEVGVLSEGLMGRFSTVGSAGAAAAPKKAQR